MTGYLEIRRQLVRGKDTQFDLRETDLQVLKVVTFERSCILVGFLMDVFIQLLQLCVQYNYYNYFLCKHCRLLQNHQDYLETHQLLSVHIQRS